MTKAKSSMAKVSNAVASVMPAMVPLQKRKIYKTELFMASLFLVAAFFAIFVHAKWAYVRPHTADRPLSRPPAHPFPSPQAVFCLLQGITFLGFGLSCCVDGHRRTTCCY